MSKEIIGRSIAQKILNISVILVSVTIPLHNNLNSWAIVFFCMAAAFSIVINKIKVQLPALVILSVSYFVWLALTYFWDTSGGFTIKNLEGYAGFLFLPLLFSNIPRLPGNIVKNVCLAFVTCITVLSIISLALAWQEYRETGDSRLFYYHYLSQQVGLNAIFFSNYCAAGISWLLYFWFIRSQKPWTPKMTWVILWCAYLFCFMFLLSSKLVLFFLLIILLFLIVNIGIIRNRPWTTVFILLVIAGVAVVAVNKLYYLRWRLSVTEFKQYQGSKDDQNGFAARVVMWTSAIELIKERPVAGYGLNGSYQALFKKYGEKDFHIGVENRYHSHNQFLQTALAAGLVGLGLLLAFIGRLGAGVLRQRNLLLGLMLLQYVCVSLVEATHESQQELIFFLFFMILFYFHPLSRLLQNRNDKKV